MLDQVKDLFKTITEDEEFFSLYAAMLKKSFDAVVAAGFSEDQALELLKTQGTGVGGN